MFISCVKPKTIRREKRNDTHTHTGTHRKEAREKHPFLDQSPPIIISLKATMLKISLH